MNTHDLLDKLARGFDTVARFMRHVDDVVPMVQAKTMASDAQRHADDIRGMMSDAAAEQLADNSAETLNAQQVADHSADERNAEEAAKHE